MSQIGITVCTALQLWFLRVSILKKWGIIFALCRHSLPGMLILRSGPIIISAKTQVRKYPATGGINYTTEHQDSNLTMICVFPLNSPFLFLPLNWVLYSMFGPYKGYQFSPGSSLNTKIGSGFKNLSCIHLSEIHGSTPLSHGVFLP